MSAKAIVKVALGLTLCVAPGGCTSEVVGGTASRNSSTSTAADGKPREGTYKCALAQQEISTSIGLPASARRTVLSEVLRESTPSSDVRVSKYRQAVRLIVEDKSTDIASVDDVPC